MTTTECNDLELGQHLWVLCNGELLIVAKIDGALEVCGPWECGIYYAECEIVELIPPPKGHEKTNRYYN